MRVDATNSLAVTAGQTPPAQPNASIRSLQAASGRGGRLALTAVAPRESPLPQSQRLALPSVNQFALQRTYWEARWRPALAGIREGLRASAGADRAIARLEEAVGHASRHGCAPSAEARRALGLAHQDAREALAGAGASKSALEALDGHHRAFVTWWQGSGRTACALAVQRLRQVSGGTDTGFGKVISGFTRTDVRQTSWYPALAATPGAPARPRLYKDRKVTYDLRYETQRLRFAAATILGKLRQGQMVHVQVLTGYLHRDTGQGRPPASTHSLAIAGYQIEKSAGGQPVRVAFEFLDPDGGGKGILQLDIERQTFQHVPASVGWVDTGDGWDYDSFWPPHRYQVMTIR